MKIAINYSYCKELQMIVDSNRSHTGSWNFRTTVSLVTSMACKTVPNVSWIPHTYQTSPGHSHLD